MAMKRCPVCGERYSDTYKYCPFCEEEEAFQDGEQIRRSGRGGRRVAGGRGKINLITPTLVVLIFIMAGLLVYLLWGDKIAQKPGGEKTPVTPPTTEVTPVKPSQPDDATGGEEDPSGGAMPEQPDEQPSAQETDYDQAMKLPDGLALSTTDFTLRMVGESATIRASGGSGTYTWASEDEGIASVDQNGKVVAISKGTVNVVVSDGNKKGVCIVRCNVSGSLPAAPATGNNGDNGSGGAHTLNREDMTLKKGEKFQLKLSGVTTALTWSTSNSSVATVSGDGTVTAVGSGNATVTVSWDGSSKSCIVRVK